MRRAGVAHWRRRRPCGAQTPNARPRRCATSSILPPRAAMDIDGLGPAVVQRSWWKRGLVHTAADIYDLRAEASLSTLDKFKEKSVSNLLAAIAASRRPMGWTSFCLLWASAISAAKGGRTAWRSTFVTMEAVQAADGGRNQRDRRLWRGDDRERAGLFCQRWYAGSGAPSAGGWRQYDATTGRKRQTVWRAKRWWLPARCPRFPARRRKRSSHRTAARRRRPSLRKQAMCSRARRRAPS